MSHSPALLSPGTPREADAPRESGPLCGATGDGDEVAEVRNWERDFHSMLGKYRAAAYELSTEREKSSMLEQIVAKLEVTSERRLDFCRKLERALAAEEALRIKGGKEFSHSAAKVERLSSLQGDLQKLRKYGKEVTLKHKQAERDILSLQAKAEGVEQRHQEELAQAWTKLEEAVGRKDRAVMEGKHVERELGEAKARLKDSKAQLKDREARLKDSEARISSLEEDLEISKATIASTQKSLAAAKEEGQGKAEQLKKMEDDRASSNEKNSFLQNRVASLNEQFLSVQKSESALQKHVDNLNLEIREQTGKREEDAKKIQSLEDELATKADQGKEMAQKIEELMEQLSESQQQRGDIARMVKEKDQEISSLRQNLQEGMQQDLEKGAPSSSQLKENARSDDVPSSGIRGRGRRWRCQDENRSGETLVASQGAQGTDAKVASKSDGRQGKKRKKKADVQRMFDEPLEALNGRTLQEVEVQKDESIKPVAMFPAPQSTRSMASSKGSKKRINKFSTRNFQMDPDLLNKRKKQK